MQKAETRLAKLDRMEKNLQRLVIEEQITFKDFKEHRLQIEADRAKLKNTVNAIKQLTSYMREGILTRNGCSVKQYSNSSTYKKVR